MSLRKQVIMNTWHCDGLNCPTPDVVAEVDPFFPCRLYAPSNKGAIAPLEIDLCDFCINTITAPDMVLYVQQLRAYVPPPPEEPNKADAPPPK